MLELDYPVQSLSVIEFIFQNLDKETAAVESPSSYACYDLTASFRLILQYGQNLPSKPVLRALKTAEKVSFASLIKLVAKHENVLMLLEERGIMQGLVGLDWL